MRTEARFCWDDLSNIATVIVKVGTLGAKAMEANLPPEFLQAFIEFAPLRKAVTRLYSHWAGQLVTEAFGDWSPIRQARRMILTTRSVPTLVEDASAKTHVRPDHFQSRSCSTNIVAFHFVVADMVLYVRFAQTGDIYWDVYSLHKSAEAQPFAGDGPCTLTDMKKAVCNLIR